jgi:hypothetical protein
LLDTAHVGHTGAAGPAASGDAEARNFRASRLQAVLYYSPSRVGTWRSLVAHLNGVQGVASSNLAVPTSLGPVGRTAMPDAEGNLFLFEPIELRAEYDARIKTLKGLLPEARENRGRLMFREDEVRRRPVPTFDVGKTREDLGALSARKRKLNDAIQRANFDHRIMVGGEETSLSQALEFRKSVNEEIGELTAAMTEAAYERIIHKEERDIVETPERSYADVRRALEEKRLLFRELNRKLRAAAYEVTVRFRDEA